MSNVQGATRIVTGLPSGAIGKQCVENPSPLRDGQRVGENHQNLGVPSLFGKVSGVGFAWEGQFGLKFLF